MHLITADPGYIALLTMLVAVPSAAVIAAVVDRILRRRRIGPDRRPLPTANAFPVVHRQDPKPEAPVQVLSIEKGEASVFPSGRDVSH
jgi:hypothetical protein